MLGKASSMRGGSRNGDAVQRRRVFMTSCASLLMLSFLTMYYSSFFNSRLHHAHSVGDSDPDMEVMKVGINRHVHQQIVDILASKEDEVIGLTAETDSASHREIDEDKEDVQDETETDDTDALTDALKDEEGIDEVRLKSLPVHMTKDDTYKRSSNPPQLGNGAMVSVRQSIVKDASNYLSRAVTIAVRYSSVRRQFGSSDDKPETQVIDYPTQQSRLFPLLATVYVFRFVGEWMGWLYADVLKRLEANDFSTLYPKCMPLTSGLKSICTSSTADGIELCRLLCGGHGYLCNSGLPELCAVYVPACTYEGDNTVLLLQVAKFSVKTLSQLGSRKPVSTAAYLGDVQRLAAERSKISTGADWSNNAVILEAFQARAARMAGAVALQLAKSDNQEAAFEEFAQDLVDAARAHCQLIIVVRFVEKLQGDIPGNGVKEMMQVLCHVYALSLVSTYAGDFLATGYLTSKQIALAKGQLRALFAKVRPNAVALVDAFDHTDHYLGSILGQFDGDVYTHLYEDTKKNRFNDSPVT